MSEYANAVARETIVALREHVRALERRSLAHEEQIKILEAKVNALRDALRDGVLG